MSDLTISIDPSSMDLIFTALAPQTPADWDFRWEDPNGGNNWISALTTMIADHQINLTLPAGETYAIMNSSGYTYIENVPGPVSPVPLPSALMLTTSLGLFGLGAARVKRWWVGVGSSPI